MSDLGTLTQAESRINADVEARIPLGDAVDLGDSIVIVGRREPERLRTREAFGRPDILLPRGARSPNPAHPQGPAALSRIARDQTLFWQGDAVGVTFELVEGIVRAVHLCENGERRILTFFCPGALIDAGCGRSAFYTAEAVTPCVMRQVRADRIADDARQARAEKALLHEMIDLLRGISGRCALSRIAWFLMRMREHLPRESQSPDVLRFVVPRLDVADHLGLSLETVSRCLTELKVKRVIDLPNRKTIRFTDARRLARIANG